MVKTFQIHFISITKKHNSQIDWTFISLNATKTKHHYPKLAGFDLRHIVMASAVSSWKVEVLIKKYENKIQEIYMMNFDSWFLVYTNSRLIWISKHWKLLFGDSAITILSQGIWTFLMLIRGGGTFQFGTISSGGGIVNGYSIFNITLENDIWFFR